LHRSIFSALHQLTLTHFNSLTSSHQIHQNLNKVANWSCLSALNKFTSSLSSSSLISLATDTQLDHASRQHREQALFDSTTSIALLPSSTWTTSFHSPTTLASNCRDQCERAFFSFFPASVLILFLFTTWFQRASTKKYLLFEEKWSSAREFREQR
jgi:hypothetical protein